MYLTMVGICYTLVAAIVGLILVIQGYLRSQETQLVMENVKFQGME